MGYMNISFWIGVMFWAFILGFWLGITFPGSNKPRKTAAASETSDGYDFYISDSQYKNFLSYDGTTQEKE